MKYKAITGLMLTLLFIGMLTLAFNIQPVKSDWTWTETIYIRSNGSVDPDTAPISTVDNITYILTDNIVGDIPDDSYAIVVERDDIVVDGAGYTLQGTKRGKGIYLSGGSNVTIKNMKIKAFGHSIYLFSSSNNTISGNTLTNSWNGTKLHESSNNTVSGNTITNNYRIFAIYKSSNNKFYHNNFINNTEQLGGLYQSFNNLWDDGYPSGGNYWSDYKERYPNATEIDASGIWDTPYEIDENNQDNYPLMEPWSPSQPTPVGGIYIPVNKLDLLAPYIGLTMLLAVAVMTVGYVKKRKRDIRINS